MQKLHMRNVRDVPLDLHAHQFRHAKASHWLEDGMNIVQISFLLGHEQLQTTMVYLDITTEEEAKALATLEDENDKKVINKVEKCQWFACRILWIINLKRSKDKIQTFFMENVNKIKLFIKWFGFYLSLDNSENPNVWISSVTLSVCIVCINF